MRQSPGWLGGKNVHESRFYIKENALANIFFCEIEKKNINKKITKYCRLYAWYIAVHFIVLHTFRFQIGVNVKVFKRKKRVQMLLRPIEIESPYRGFSF